MKAGLEVSAPRGAQTIERALGVLECFAPGHDRWRTTTLARRCGLPLATTHRILRVLESYEYVERDHGSGEYTLGRAAASFARPEPELAAARQAAAPLLRAVHRATGARAVLTALSGSRDHAITVEAVGGAADDGDDAGPGAHEARPLHAGAPAKVLLGRLSADELARLLDRSLEPVGPATITRPERLRREAEAIRRRGWAFSREEARPGAWAVAVAVPGPSPLALGVSAPLAIFDRDRARRHLALLAETARRLSRARDESFPDHSDSETRRAG